MPASDTRDTTSRILADPRGFTSEAHASPILTTHLGKEETGAAACGTCVSSACCLLYLTMSPDITSQAQVVYAKRMFSLSHVNIFLKD
jgi:hypothetical protein